MSKAVPQNRQPDQFPISRAETRQMFLEAAGLTPAEAALIMRRSVDKLVEKLEATETKFFALDGKVTDEREVIAHAIQLKAAEDLAQLGVDIMGLKQAATRENTTPPQVSIDLSGWTVQTPSKDVTPDDTQG